MTRKAGQGSAGRQVRGVFALVVALVVALTLVLTLSGTADAKKGTKAKKTSTTAATLATLKIQTAAVTVKAAGATKYAKAKDGQALHEGDALRADAAGKAEINYTDGSLHPPGQLDRVSRSRSSPTSTRRPSDPGIPHRG